jgi:hypothetical protein
LIGVQASSIVKVSGAKKGKKVRSEFFLFCIGLVAVRVVQHRAVIPPAEKLRVLHGALHAAGDAALNAALHAAGNTTLDGALHAAGYAALDGALHAASNTALNSALHSAGDTHVDCWLVWGGG